MNNVASSRSWRAWWLAALLGVAATAAGEDAFAQHAAERSLLPANAKPPPPPIPGLKGTALLAAYDEGFRLRTNDGATDLRLAWSAQLERAPFGDRTELVSGFDIRRARLDFIATVSRRLFMRIGLAAEDAPYIRNAFADYEVDDLLHVRIGQMKVPFSTEWATFDNQENFLERAYSQPIHPFLDRGVLFWGKLRGAVLVWNAGIFAGAGVDADAPRGDVDAGKELAFRLFAQPFRNERTGGLRALRGAHFVVQETWEEASVATKRFELRGTTTPLFESSTWRWRGGERGTLASKARIGGELHYLVGPVTFSGEAATLRWTQLDQTSGAVHAASVWASVFLTGEEKVLDNFGWRQPRTPIAFAMPSASTSWPPLARAKAIEASCSWTSGKGGALRASSSIRASTVARLRHRSPPRRKPAACTSS